MAKKQKVKMGSDQKLIKKLAKQWDMLCECSHELIAHLNGPCSWCVEITNYEEYVICNKYTPIMSIELIKENTVTI